MATTRLTPLHIGKSRNASNAISDIIDYVENPQKTDNGRLIAAYQCDSRTVDADFLLSKRQYANTTGRRQGDNDVLAYQIRQSFKPGEITPEEANRLGYELALSFTKGRHQFIVATHIDKAHIHNHIIFNSTSLDCSRKFRDFLGSARAVRRLNDRICIENGLSIVEEPAKNGKDYGKWLGDNKPLTFQDKLRQTIDAALDQKPADFDAFLRLMKDAGYAVKRGKYIKLTGSDQQRGTRLDTLRGDYTEQAIRERIVGTRQHTAALKSNASATKEKVNLLIDIQSKIQQGKSAGYEQWAKVFNLKQAAKTLMFLQENNLTDYDKLTEETKLAAKRFTELSAEIKARENRMAEITELQKHIGNYHRTRDIFTQYKQSGYSKKYKAEHIEQLTIYEASRKAFDALKLEKFPRMETLKQEWATLAAEKKKLYSTYREAKEKMQTLANAKANADTLLRIPPAGTERKNDNLRR